MLEELGRAATASPFLGTVLAVGALGLVEPSPARDELLAGIAAGDVVATVAVPTGAVDLDAGRLPFRLERVGRRGSRRRAACRSCPTRPAPTASSSSPTIRRPAPRSSRSRPAPASRCGPRPWSTRTRSLRRGRRRRHARRRRPVLAARRRPARRCSSAASLAVAVDSLGVAGAALDATVAYAADRHQFGRPIGSFQAVKHACADVAVELTISRRLVADAVERVVAGAPDADVAVAMAKAHAVETAVTATGTGAAAPRGHRLHVGARTPRAPEAGGAEPLALRIARRPPRLAGPPLRLTFRR